jgi:hypothetical protein
MWNGVAPKGPFLTAVFAPMVAGEERVACLTVATAPGHSAGLPRTGYNAIVMRIQLGIRGQNVLRGVGQTEPPSARLAETADTYLPEPSKAPAREISSAFRALRT